MLNTLPMLCTRLFNAKMPYPENNPSTQNDVAAQLYNGTLQRIPFSESGKTSVMYGAPISLDSSIYKMQVNVK
jgi:hypothetical protein